MSKSKKRAKSKATIARELNEIVADKYPGYTIIWSNQLRMFEVWNEGYVHYRRETEQQIRELIGVSDE